MATQDVLAGAPVVGGQSPLGLAMEDLVKKLEADPELTEKIFQSIKEPIIQDCKTKAIKATVLAAAGLGGTFLATTGLWASSPLSYVVQSIGVAFMLGSVVGLRKVFQVAVPEEMQSHEDKLKVE